MVLRLQVALKWRDINIENIRVVSLAACLKMEEIVTWRGLKSQGPLFGFIRNLNYPGHITSPSHSHCAIWSFGQLRGDAMLTRFLFFQVSLENFLGNRFKIWIIIVMYTAVCTCCGMYVYVQHWDSVSHPFQGHGNVAYHCISIGTGRLRHLRGTATDPTAFRITTLRTTTSRLMSYIWVRSVSGSKSRRKIICRVQNVLQCVITVSKNNCIQTHNKSFKWMSKQVTISTYQLWI